MPKLIIFIPLLIILLPIVFSETQIFSGKVITDTEKIIDNSSFKFTYDEKSDKIFVQTPTTALIIENGKCKSSNVFKVCINSAAYFDRNITTYVTYYKIDTNIYKLTGSLTTTSIATSSTLLQGESTELSITITNPTDFDITNIRFAQDLSQFSIREVKGCVSEGNSIMWQGSLMPKYDKICAVKILAEKDGAYSLSGNLSYFNSYETEKKTTNPVSITVLPKQLKVSQIIDKNVEVRQPFYLNMSLENIHKDEKIDASATIELPSNIALLKQVEGFAKETGILRHKSVFEPGAVKNFSFYLMASAEGSSPIKQKFDYTIKDVRDVIENFTFINPIEPKPVINFTSEYSEVAPEQKFIVIAKLKNPSRVHKLTGIKVSLSAPYNSRIDEELDKLSPNESYTIISNTLAIPKNAEADVKGENKTITLNLTVEYKFYEDVKSANKTLAIKIKQKSMNDTVAIASKGTPLQPRETSTNKTSAINPANNTIHVTIQPEKPKFEFFSLKMLLVGVVIFAIFLVVSVIINRKRAKDSKEEEESAVKELQENLPKE